MALDLKRLEKQLDDALDKMTDQDFNNWIKKEKMKLEITKEKVLEAANKCEQAKETLRTLFPECFGEEITKKRGLYYFGDEMIIVDICAIGRFKNKSFHLDGGFNWEIKTNLLGHHILIPTRK